MKSRLVKLILRYVILFKEVFSAASVLPNSAYLSNKVGKSLTDPSLVLVWNKTETSVALSDEGDCIYTGKFSSEPETSNVLVTGCLGEKLNVQIQSKEFGDMLFVTEGREVLAVEVEEEDFAGDYIDYDYNYEETCRFKHKWYDQRTIRNNKNTTYQNIFKQ
jgi:hypothetical protein